MNSGFSSALGLDASYRLGMKRPTDLLAPGIPLVRDPDQRDHPQQLSSSNDDRMIVMILRITNPRHHLL
ncbi:hypothetical protein JTE90_025874 [Oedothorax gibbosus]|uniref:Uncharacterized protein n=1 Tax=Oedothorax gibbosus TaxID=931172 RepID=A0AAV6ULV6_9ARAC|nr:hypothetical protein JTE90_025874 [Oedothorax gibbosus]